MEQLELNVQERRVVVLQGLGAAGYRWTVSVDDPGVVRVERAAAEPAAAPGAPGSRSVDERFEITGLAAGRTIVRCVQGRAFEPHAAPRASHEIEVHVA
ncbi:protease inhibitor I42 family protein [Burkholderia sp. FERM BP-3421]|jgi:predicted secreted protein|uniref:protease inhibitor I42 family protein n=1 Tax=Burkholderia sp. FERM BP-3421 TaxID=1494466 RepID=UPI002362279B|nr:protease inhibitor I42 family protein [Burkholderia sp. FERM BP-3421]WDD91876.1 protease inhibitor I42 family protein [Burkholderia sp. FERM BP-3421]